MVATVKVKDVLHRVSVLLQDDATQFTRWPEHELVEWLNDGQVAITKFLPAACSRIDVVKLKPGTRQSIETIAAADCKPGDGTTPGVPIYGTQLLDVIRNMGVDGLTPGKAIRIVPRDVKDSQTPMWHTDPNTAGVVSQFTHDPRMPRYYYAIPPVPATPVVWAEIAYTAQPLAIPNTAAAGSEAYKWTDNTSVATIGVADEFVDDLVNYVVARANMKPVNWADNNKAVAFTNLFTGSLNAKVSALTGNNPNLRQLPFAPQPIGEAA